MALRDHPDRILCGGATLVGTGAASLLLLAVLSLSRTRCSVFDILFSNHACHQNWWVELALFLFPIVGIVCFFVIAFAREKKLKRLAEVAGVIYAVMMLYFFASASSSLAVTH